MGYSPWQVSVAVCLCVINSQTIIAFWNVNNLLIVYQKKGPSSFYGSVELSVLRTCTYKNLLLNYLLHHANWLLPEMILFHTLFTLPQQLLNVLTLPQNFLSPEEKPRHSERLRSDMYEHHPVSSRSRTGTHSRAAIDTPPPTVTHHPRNRYRGDVIAGR